MDRQSLLQQTMGRRPLSLSEQYRALISSSTLDPSFATSSPSHHHQPGLLISSAFVHVITDKWSGF